MPPSYVGEIVRAAQTTPGLQLVTATAGAAAGSTGIAWIASINTSAIPFGTFTDVRGNVWREVKATRQSGPIYEFGLYYCHLTTALVAGDGLGVTLSNGGGAVFAEFAGVPRTTPLQQPLNATVTESSPPGTTTIAVPGLSVPGGALMLAGLGVDTLTAQTGTPEAAWTSLTRLQHSAFDDWMYPAYRVPGAAGTYGFSLVVTPTMQLHGGGLIYFPLGIGLGFDRGRTDQRPLVAYSTSTATLGVVRYNDASPAEAAIGTVTVDTDIASCALLARGSGVWDVIYIQGTSVLYRTSRTQGVSWSVATTIATGYADLTFDLDEKAGLLGVALFDGVNNRWMLTVGSLDAAGTGWTWSSPTVIVTNALAAGQIRSRRDGAWEFAFITAAGAATITRCRSMKATGVVVWS